MAQFNSFVRIPLLALRQRLRPLPAMSMLAPETLSMRVWPSDIDFNLHMNNSRYLLRMDYGRIHLIASTGMMELAMRRRWQPLIGSVFITYRRSLRLWQPFTLTSRNLCWDEKWVYTEQTFTSAAGLAAVAWVKGLFREAGSSGRNIAPQQIVDQLEPGLVSPPVPPALAEWNELTRGKLTGTAAADPGRGAATAGN
ncbi:MAG TPA: thioesterase family protein [Acidisarcina sp.]